MAHYDCSYCGAYGGIAFGYCAECTPARYNEISGEISELYSHARLAWDEKVADAMAELEELKKQFIEDLVGEEIKALEIERWNLLPERKREHTPCPV